MCGDSWRNVEFDGFEYLNMHPGEGPSYSSMYKVQKGWIFLKLGKS